MEPSPSAAARQPRTLLQTLDFWRDLRGACCETAFPSLYGGPFMPWLGVANAFARAQTSAEEFRFLPRVEAALRHIGSGGFAEAMIRMMRPQRGHAAASQPRSHVTRRARCGAA